MTQKTQKQALDITSVRALVESIMSMLDDLGLSPKRATATQNAAAEVRKEGSTSTFLPQLVDALKTGNERAKDLAAKLEAAADQPDDTAKAVNDDTACDEEPEVVLRPPPSVDTMRSTYSHVSSPRYRVMLTETQRLTREAGVHFLRYRWELGRLAGELAPASSSGTYGMKFLEKFAKDLQKLGCPLAVNSIRESLRLYRAFDEEQLKRAIELNLSVRKAIPLCGEGVTPEVRDAIMDQIGGTNATPWHVRRLVLAAQSETEPKKVSDRALKAKNELRELQRLCRSIERLAEKLDVWADTVEEIKQHADAETLDQTTRLRSEMERAVSYLEGVWESQRKAPESDKADARVA